ncbi:MAG: chromosomal replication initiator protein DnaA [Chloroflexi bacterium]|nr:chromosomal replication initiator protein DnaA [Chloroflexota bacterium]
MIQTQSAREIWEATLGELQVQISKPNYRTWLDKTVGLSFHNGEFVVGVPNTFVAEYLKQNQSSLIEKTLISISGSDVRVLFEVHNANLSGQFKSTITARLHPQYTFDSFVVGTSNSVACAASTQIVENPGSSYNPLVVCAKSGLGKTHLLYAIAHAALSRNMNVLCTNAEQFTTEFVNAVHREGNPGKFRNKYRNVDMLLIDDIRFICGKKQTEEAFLHTFNELHNNNRQIVITADCLPKEMPLLDERLSSRLGGGLVTKIKPPSFDTRLAILRAKSRQNGVNIGEDTLELIARRVHQNIRELEGCLNAVVAYAKLLRAAVTPDVATQAMDNLTGNEPAETRHTPTLIIDAVASSYELTTDDIIGKKRDKETALARHVAIYLLKEATNFSLAQIGQELGGRNPSTITRAYDKITADIETNPILHRKVREIEQKIASSQISS